MVKKTAKGAGQGADPAPSVVLVDGRFIRPGDDRYLPEGAEPKSAAALSDMFVARARSQPEVRAAAIIQKLEGGNAINVNALIDELNVQTAQVNSGDMSRPEALLLAQAHTLDAIFASLAMRSKVNLDGGCLDAGETFMRMALKAQAQSARTIEALAELKSPRSVAFVKQANIAHGPQQINNGVTARAGESENAQSKLSEITHELPAHNRTQSLASSINPPLEAVGEIDRAEVAGRKSQGSPERL